MPGDSGRATLELLIKVAEAQIKQITRTRNEFSDLNKELEEFGGAGSGIDTSGLDRLQGELQQTVRDARALSREGKVLEREFNTAVRNLAKASDRINFDPSSASAQRLRAEVDRAGRALLEFGRRAPQALDRTEKEMEDVERAARRARSEFSKFQSEAKPGNFRKLTSTFHDLRTAVTGFLGAIVVRKLAELGAEAVRTSVSLQRLRNQLDAIEGVAAEETLDRIAKRADKLGINLVGLEKVTVDFISTAARMGVTVDEAVFIIEGLTEAALGAGRNTEELKRAIVQVQQALGKGKFEMQDFKIIMEVLPGVLTAVSKGLGKTTEEIFDLQKKGLLPAKEVARALAEELPGLFGDAVQKNAQDLEADVNRLTNQLELNKRAFGDAAKGGIQDMTGRLAEAAVEAKQLAGFLGDLVAVIAKEGTLDFSTFGRAIARNMERQKEAAEAVERAHEKAARAARERAEAEKRAAREAAEAAEKAARALEAYVDDLKNLVAETKRAYEAERDERERTLDEMRQLEEEHTQQLIDEFKRRSKDFNVAEKDRLEVAEEVADSLLELEKETSQKRVEIIQEALEEAETLPAKEREEALKEARDKLLEIEAELAEKREEIVKEGLEKLEDLEEKRAEKAIKELAKIAKEEEKLARRRAELLEESLEKVRKFFDEQKKLFQPPDAQDDSGRAEELARLKQELDSLQLKPLLSQNDLDRMQELRSRIFDLQAGVGQAQESFGDFQKSLADDSRKAAESLAKLTDTEAFQLAFEQLGDAERQFALSAIRDFEEAAAGANLNQQRIRELEALFEQLGLTGPKSIGGIADALEGLKDTPTETTQRLQELSQKAAELKAQADPAAEAVERIADGSERAGTALPGMADGLGQAGTAANDASGPVGEVAGSVSDLAESAGDAADGLSSLASDVPTVADGLSQLATSSGEAAGPVGEVAAAVGELETSTSGTAENLASMAETLPTAREQLGLLLELLTQQAEEGTLSEFFTTLSEGNKTLEDAAGFLEQLATSGTVWVNEVAPGFPEAGDKVKQGLDTITAEAILGKLNDLDTALAGVAAGMNDTAENAGNVVTAAEDLRAILQPLQEGLQRFVDFSRSTLIPSLNEQATSWRELVVQAESYRVKLGEEIPQAADEMALRVSDAFARADAAGQALESRLDRIISKLRQVGDG